jgi:exonuclease V gamma subunit
MKFIPLFENRSTISTFFNVSQTVARFLSDRKFVRFRPLASSIAQSLQLATSALEGQTVLVALAHAALTA